MKTESNRTIALIAVYTERYVLSVVYLCFAVARFSEFTGILSGRIKLATTLFVDAGDQLILFLVSLFTGLFLLLGRRAAVPPQKLKLVLVPLFTAFYNILYSTVPSFPASWRVNLCPPAWQAPLLAAGVACIIIGPAFGFWAMLHLGRSFGIYVTVRKVVTTGPYKWVRHPIYLGWTFMLIGWVLANCSYAYFLLVTIHVSLLYYRAYLEQTQLAVHSAEYREYMKRTRFIFPRLHIPSSS